jgi:hypothetical protein
MLSFQYYLFGYEMDSKTDRHSSLRIARSAIPAVSIHAVHFALQGSFQAHYSTAA